jgi:hypothetical protein
MTREEFRIKFSQAVGEDDTDLFEIKESRDPSTLVFQQQVELSFKGLDTLTNIAEVVAESLFEEIEKLRESEEEKIQIIKRLEDLLFKAENDRTYWFDRHNIELARNVRLVERINNLERRPEDDQSKEDQSPKE